MDPQRDDGVLWAPPRALAPALLGLLAAAVYLPSLRNGLTNWDDLEYVPQSPIATRGLAGIPSAFTRTLDDAWYPLTHSAYALVYAVAKDAALPYHALQLILFALAAALAPAALAAFGVSRRVAFWAALLWLVHPLRVETVVWAANLKDTLSLVLAVASFALLGNGRRWSSAAVWSAALLAKSTVFPLALLVPLLELRVGAKPGRALTRALPWLVPATAIAAVAAAVHLGSPTAAFRFVPGGSLGAALPSVLWLPWRYLGAILWPGHPQAVYAFSPVGWLDLRLAAALVLWAGWAAVLWVRRAQRWPWLTGTAAWWLPFAAVTGLVPLAFHVADRYTLLPSLAVAAGVALGADALASRWRPARLAAPALLLAAATGLTAMTLTRIPEWRSSVTLWEADLAREPGAIAVHLNLAGAYGGEGRWDEATRELELLRRHDPSRLQTVSDLFFACAAKGKLPADRIERYVNAIERSNKDTHALRAVAESALKDGQLPCATLVAEALYGWKRNPSSEALMATVEVARGRYEPAAAHARAALAADPSDESPRVQLVIALISLGRSEEALAVTAVPARDPRIQALLETARSFARAGPGRREAPP
ncbi:MAG: tetratricopeptide repeat protein [Myxococcaceae bacterium]